MRKRRSTAASEEGAHASSASTTNQAQYAERGYERASIPSPSFLDDSNTSLAQAVMLLQRGPRGILPAENAFFRRYSIRHTVLMKAVPAVDLEHGLGLCNFTSLKTGQVAFKGFRDDAKSGLAFSAIPGVQADGSPIFGAAADTGAKTVREHVRSHSLRGVRVMFGLYAAAAGMLLTKESDRATFEMARSRLLEAEKMFQSGAPFQQFAGFQATAPDGTVINDNQISQPWLPVMMLERVPTKDESEVRAYRVWLHLYTDAMEVMAVLCTWLAQRYCEHYSFVNGLGHTQWEVEEQDKPQAQQEQEARPAKKPRSKSKSRKTEQMTIPETYHHRGKAPGKKRKAAASVGMLDDLDNAVAGLEIDMSAMSVRTDPKTPISTNEQSAPPSPGLVQIFDEMQTDAERTSGGANKGDNDDDDDDLDVGPALQRLQAAQSNSTLDANEQDNEMELELEDNDGDEDNATDGNYGEAAKDDAAYNHLDEDPASSANAADPNNEHELAKPKHSRKKGVSGPQYHYKYGHNWDETPAERRKSDRHTPLHQWERDLLSIIRETWNRDTITAGQVRELLEPELVGAAMEYTAPPVDHSADAASTERLYEPDTPEPNLDQQYYAMGARQTMLMQQRFIDRDWTFAGVPDNTRQPGKGLRTIHPGYIFPGHALSTWCDTSVPTKQLFAGSYYAMPYAGRLKRASAATSQSAKLCDLIDQTCAPFARVLGARTPHPVDAVMALAIFGTENQLPVEPEVLGERFKGYPDEQHVFVMPPAMCMPWNCLLTFLPPPANATNPSVAIGEIGNWNLNNPTGLSAADAVETAFNDSPVKNTEYLYHLLKWATRYIVPMPYSNAFDPALERVAPRQWGWYEQTPQLTTLLTNYILFGSKVDIHGLFRSPETSARHQDVLRTAFEIDYATELLSLQSDMAEQHEPSVLPPVPWVDGVSTNRLTRDACVSPAVLGLLLAGRQMMRYLRATSESMYKYWQSCMNFEALTSSYGLRILQAEHHTSAPFAFDTDAAQKKLGSMDWPGWFDADGSQGDHIGSTDWSRFLDRTRQTNNLLFNHLQLSALSEDTPIIEVSTFVTRIRTWNSVFAWRGDNAFGFMPETNQRKRRYMQGRLYDLINRKTVSMLEMAQNLEHRQAALEARAVRRRDISGALAADTVGLADNTADISAVRELDNEIREQALHGMGAGSDDQTSAGGSSAPTTTKSSAKRAVVINHYEPMIPPDASYFENNGWFQVGAMASDARQDIEAFRCCTNWNNFLAAYQVKHGRFVAQLTEPLEMYLLATRVNRKKLHVSQVYSYAQLEAARQCAINATTILASIGRAVATNNIRPLYLRKSPKHPERRPVVPETFESVLTHWSKEYSRVDYISSRFPFRELFDRWGTIDTVYGCMDRMITEAFMRKGIGEGNTQHMVGFGKTLWSCAISSCNMENRDDDTAGVSVMCSGGTGEGKTKVIETTLQLFVPNTWTVYSGFSKNALNVEENHDGRIEFLDEGFARVMSGDKKVADEELVNEWKFMLSHGYLKKRRLIKTENGKLVPENAWAPRKTTLILAQNTVASSEKALMARFTQLAARTIVSDRSQPLYDTLPAHAAQMASMDTEIRCDQDERVLFGPRMLHAVKVILEMLIHAGVLKTETERTVTYTNSMLDPFKEKVEYQGKMARVHVNMARLIRSEVTNYAAMAILLDYALYHDELGRFGGCTSVPFEFIVAAAPKYMYAVTAHAVKTATALFYTLVDNQEHFNVARGLVAAAKHNLAPDAPHIRFLVEQVPRGHLAGAMQLSVQQERIKANNSYVMWSNDVVGSASASHQSALSQYGGMPSGGDYEEMVPVLDMNYVVIDFPNANTAKQFYAALKKHLPADGTYDENHLPPIVSQLSELEFDITDDTDQNSNLAGAYNEVLRRLAAARASIRDNPQIFYGETLPPSTTSQQSVTTIAMTPPGTPDGGTRRTSTRAAGNNATAAARAKGTITAAFPVLPSNTDMFSVLEPQNTRTYGSSWDAGAYYRSSFTYEPGMALTLQTAAECGLPLRRYDYHERNRTPLIRVFAHVPTVVNRTSVGGGSGGGGSGHRGDGGSGNGGGGSGGGGGGGTGSFVTTSSVGNRKYRIAVYYDYLKRVLNMMKGSGAVAHQEMDDAELSYFVQYEKLCKPMKGSMISALEDQLFKTEQREPYPEYVPKELYSTQKDIGADAVYLSETMPTTIMANATSGYVAQFTEAVVHKVFEHPASSGIVKPVEDFLRALKINIRRVGAMMTVADVVEARYGNDEYRVTVNRSQMPRFATTLNKFQQALSRRATLPTLENVDHMTQKGSDRFIAAIAETQRQRHRIRQGTRIVAYNVDAESYLAYCAKCRPPRDPCDPKNYMTLPLLYKRGMKAFLQETLRTEWAVELSCQRETVARHINDGNLDEMAEITYPLMDYNFQLKRHIYVLVVQRFKQLGEFIDDFDPTVFCADKTPARWLRETALQISQALINNGYQHIEQPSAITGSALPCATGLSPAKPAASHAKAAAAAAAARLVQRISTSSHEEEDEYDDEDAMQM